MRARIASASTSWISIPRCPGRQSRPRSFHSAMVWGIFRRSIRFSAGALLPFCYAAGANAEQRMRLRHFDLRPTAAPARVACRELLHEVGPFILELAPRYPEPVGAALAVDFRSVEPVSAGCRFVAHHPK